jgi:pimeloyl-ACP methyl ester carboxylesterase
VPGGRGAIATFVLIHGSGDGGWYWHIVADELRARGHDVLAPDLPAGDDSATLETYADAVLDAIGDRSDPVVVAQSFGGFTAPLVCERVRSQLLVLLAAMIPSPGEPPDDWWTATRYRDDVTSNGDDVITTFYHDVPRALAAEALRRERDHPSATAMREPWPLERWPHVPTRVLLCRDDRFFPPAFLRRVAHERLSITPDEIDGGHCIALSRPIPLADRLETYLAPSRTA